MPCIFSIFSFHGGNIGVVLKALPFELSKVFGAAVHGMLATDTMKAMKATAKGLGDCFKSSKCIKARYL